LRIFTVAAAISLGCSYVYVGLDAINKSVQPTPILHVEYLENNYSAYIHTHPQYNKIYNKILEYTKSHKKAKEYAEIILSESRNYDLDPLYVTAVIEQESSFRSNIYSYVGAVGLMQVMPFWRKILGSRTDDLRDPRVNIQYGCAVLSRYLKKYKTMDKALQAYNGAKYSTKYSRKINTIVLAMNDK